MLFIETKVLVLQGEDDMVEFSEEDEPKSIEEALSTLVSDKWKKTMKEKIELIKVNKV